MADRVPSRSGDHWATTSETPGSASLKATTTSSFSLLDPPKAMPLHLVFHMGSSFSSRRQLSAQQAGETTGGTHDGPHQSPTIEETPLIRNKKLVKLCSRCRRIDFNYLFSPGNYAYTCKPGLFLGNLENETWCRLCRFFYSMRCRSEGDGAEEAYTLQPYLLGSDYARSAAYPVSRYAPSMVLCVLPAEPDKLLYYFNLNGPPTNVDWIVPQSSTAAPFFGNAKPSLSALPFSQTSINYPLLRAWCEHCDIHHTTCASAKKMIPGSDKQGIGPVVRCIDCHTREIVEIDSSDRYLALSYVWGAQSAPVSAYIIGTTQKLSPSTVRLLPNAIPKLIEDAIIVVKRLGERYLWVDQYCIDQNNADEKHAQIENMASIYEGAYATIVAFSASDSASGLRGVNNFPRKPFPSVPQTKHPLSALRPSAINSAQLVASSVWMTRGWTYQEAILSRRLLIFTDYQVEFICSNAVWHECTLPQMGDIYSGQLRTASGDQVVNFLRAISPTERPEWDDRTPVFTEELFGYIEEYSGRHLSYQSDALNAVTGLLSRISIVTYLGIPVYHASDLKELERPSPIASEQEDIDAYRYKQSLLVQFFVCLTWYPAHESLLRRDAFPSWSWLGWEGRVKFPDMNLPVVYKYCATQVSSLWIPQQVTHDNGEIQVPFLQFLQGNLLDKGTTSVLPHVSNYLWVEGPVMKMSFALEQSIRNGSKHESFVFRSSHPHMRVMESELVAPRISFRTCKPDSKSQETMHQRVVTEEWDCLLLLTVEANKSAHGYFLILDKNVDDVPGDGNTEEAGDHHYYVVGSAELEIQTWIDPIRWPRRRVELG